MNVLFLYLPKKHNLIKLFLNHNSLIKISQTLFSPETHDSNLNLLRNHRTTTLFTLHFIICSQITQKLIFRMLTVLNLFHQVFELNTASCCLLCKLKFRHPTKMIKLGKNIKLLSRQKTISRKF